MLVESSKEDFHDVHVLSGLDVIKRKTDHNTSETSLKKGFFFVLNNSQSQLVYMKVVLLFLKLII